MAIIGETTTSEKSQLNSKINIVYHLMRHGGFFQCIQSILFKGDITINEILTTEFINIQKEK